MQVEGREAMDFALHFIFFTFLLIISYSSSMPLLPPSPHYGIHPQDVKYFSSNTIKCKDGSKSFTIDRLNDNFCDCIDGTDEPGTSACPNGRFSCINQGSKPQLLFSSRVNDHLCDCCDGSDEYDGAVSCVDTCIRDANFSNIENDDIIGVVSSDTKAQTKLRSSLEDLVHKLKELKIVIVLEVGFIIMAFRLLRRHMRYKRRSYR